MKEETLKELASHVTDWDNEYFKFRAFATEADYRNDNPLRFDFCSEIRNGNFTIGQLNFMARGIVEGMRCKYKHPRVEFCFVNSDGFIYRMNCWS